MRVWIPSQAESGRADRRMKAWSAVALWLLAVLLLTACGGPVPTGTSPLPATPSTAHQGGDDVCLPDAQGEGSCAQPTTEGPSQAATPWSGPAGTGARTPPAGTTPTRAATPAPTVPLSPTEVPVADLLAFDTVRDGNSEIYLLNTATGALTNLTRHPADDRSPALRPDGGAIAFESHRDGNWEIYCLDLVSGKVARLTEELDFDGGPAWSPDGTRLAFESYRDGNLEIYTMAGDGSNLRPVTDNQAGDYGPAWSPDGTSIAFTSWRDGNKEIYLVPAGGGEARNLTNNPADDEDPFWQPRTNLITFVSWRDVADEGNRNAEIYLLSPGGRPAGRLTNNPWPDLDPAQDAFGRLVWITYDPGPAFETYDPYRPGDYHLYRLWSGGTTQLTGTVWDDRRPASTFGLTEPGPRPVQLLPALPATVDLMPRPPVGSLADVVEAPGILAGRDGPPILVNEMVLPSLQAWRQDVLAATGYDFLHETLGSWRNIDSVRKKAMYAYDYGFLSWHKAGRALDLALEFKVDGADQLLLVREDLGESVFWRLYLRAAKQDGTQGEPLRDNPWLRWWWIVPSEDPDAYEAGGKRLPVPSGYYVDLTALAKRHGWERIASYAIEGDYHWLTDTNGTEYWHYERTDGLTWWEAMSQLYEPETLGENVGWAVGLERAQTEEMMRSKGVPTPTP